jgi:prevent-host-death family protein
MYPLILVFELEWSPHRTLPLKSAPLTKLVSVCTVVHEFTPAPAVKKKHPIAVREAVSLYDAKTHLSALVDRAHAGEEIVIMKSGRALARLVPLNDQRGLRISGRGKGAWRLSKDFDAPLSDDLLNAFEGTS